MNPRDKRIWRIERLAKDAFRDHQITIELNHGVYRHFLCGRLSTGIYAFNITTIPGRLIVTGDIGTLIVERLNDMFEWAPNAVGSINYFAEKVPSELATKEYDQDMAFEFLAELQVLEGTESKLALQAAELEDYVDDQARFEIALYESGIIDGCDFPCLANWKPSFLWCREAVKWFFDNYQWDQETATAEEAVT